MSELQSPGAPGTSTQPVFSLVFVLATLAIAAVGLGLEEPNARAVFSQTSVFLAEPDDYLRTYRAKRIAAGECVSFVKMAEINAPTGVELDGCAPMDYLLAGAGLLFGRFITHDDSLGTIAAWVPACLGVVYIVCLTGAMRRGFGWGPAVLTGLMLVFWPALRCVFRVGHPDSQCLIELLLVVALASWIPRARRDGTPGRPTRRAAAISGLAAGLAIWTGAHAVFFWLALLLGLTFACVFGPLHARRAYAEARQVWLCAAALPVIAGYVVENWPEYNVVSLDKISMVHLALIGLGFLAPRRVGAAATAAADGSKKSVATGTIGSPPRQSETTRHIALLAAMAAFTLWMAVDRTRVLDVEDLRRTVRPDLAEDAPESGARHALIPADAPMLESVGFLPYALPPLVVFFLLSNRVPRPVKGTLGLLAPIAVVLAIRQPAWLIHFLPVIPLVAVIGMWELVRILLGRRLSGWPIVCFIPAAAALAVLVHPSAKHVASWTVGDALRANAHLEPIDFTAQQIVAHEMAHPSHDRNRRAILSDASQGPMLLYCTGLPVVAVTGSHASQGRLEAARFYAERDPLRARRQLDRLGVRYVVLPTRSREHLGRPGMTELSRQALRDPTPERVDEFGRTMQEPNGEGHEVRKTILQRLLNEPDGNVIPGVERIAGIKDEDRTPKNPAPEAGLLFVVHELPQGSLPTTSSAPTR